jgi:hypothetical protein
MTNPVNDGNTSLIDQACDQTQNKPITIRGSTLYWIFRKPIQTIERIAVHDDIDAEAERKSALVYIVSVILLHAVMQAPEYSILFLRIGQDLSWVMAIITLVVDALFIPFLLSWAFIRLYPIVLHRVQMMFSGSATENEVRVSFAWSVLWVHVTIAVIWLCFFFLSSAFNGEISDWWLIFLLILTVFVVIVSLIIHICMMATVLRLSFGSTAFVLVMSGCIPVALLYFGSFSLNQMARLMGYGL